MENEKNHTFSRSWELDALRAWANCLIVVHHVGLVEIPLQGGIEHSILYWIVTRLAWPLPTFFLLSGYLLMRFYHPAFYLQKVKGRIRRLMVPFWIWNALYVLIFAGTLLLLPTGLHITGSYDGSIYWFLGKIVGFAYEPANPPFWYIRAVFVYALLIPLLYWVLKSLWGATVLLVLCCMWGWISSKMGYEVGGGLLTVAPAYSIIAYIVGGILGVRNFDLITVSHRYAGIWIAFGVGGYLGEFLLPTWLAEIKFLMIVLQTCFWFGCIKIISRIMAHPSMAVVVESSFFIFAAHFLLRIPIGKLQGTLGKWGCDVPLFTSVRVVLSVLLAFVLCVWGYLLMRRIMPRWVCILLGR